MEKTKIIVIVGPTAVGKSKVAMEVAERFNGEIVSGDSMQIYRYMDIGTAKPSTEDRKRVRHHLIDIRNPDDDFDAAQFKDEASKAIIGIESRRALPIVVGGTGLYLKALTEGIFDVPEVDKALRERLRKEAEESGLPVLYKRLLDVDPAAAAKIGPRNTHRILRALEVFYLTGKPISEYQKEHSFSERPYVSLKIGLLKERETLYKDIDERVEGMIKAGFVEEVSGMLKMGYGLDLKAMQSIGYCHICSYLKGDYTLGEAVTLMKRDTRHYAKRQLTWFRRDKEIAWFDVNGGDYLGNIFSEVRGFIGGIK